MPLRQVVALTTSSPKNIMQDTAQRRVLDILEGKLIDVERVDAATQKGRRDELLSCPGAARACYPQLFMQRPACAGGALSFACSLEGFEEAVECSGLPPDVLRDTRAAGFEVTTFEDVFFDVLHCGVASSLAAATNRLLLATGVLLAGGSSLFALSSDVAAMVAGHITPADARRMFEEGAAGCRSGHGSGVPKQLEEDKRGAVDATEQQGVPPAIAEDQ